MRILCVKTSPLHPLNRGGDLRTFHMLRYLHRHHSVHFVGMVSTPEQEAGKEQASEYCESAHWVRHELPSLGSKAFKLGALVNLFSSSLPYAVTRFVSSKLESTVASLLQSNRYDLLICDFLFPTASLPWNLYDPKAGARWVIAQHNVETKIWDRRAQDKGALTAWYWQSQARRMRRFEQRACAKFDGVLTVSDDDTRTLQSEFGLTNVLGAVATGVDAAFLQAMPRCPAARPLIVFVGSMDWHANVDAVLFFAQEVWPHVRMELAHAVFRVVGRQPPESVKRLAEGDSGIEVTGTVPDVRPHWRSAHATVVPLRIGGGTRLKIYEAMAAEVPVVSTRIGAEGLPVQDGRHLLLADDPAGLADALIRVCRDEALARSLASTAMEEIVQTHSWDAAARQFEALCLQVVAS